MRGVLLAAALGWPALAGAQALFTGETGGRGGSAVILTANGIRPDGGTTYANFWGAYTRGLHDRMDAFALYGNVSALGRTQHYAGVGANTSLARRSRLGVDVSLLTILSAPFNRRRDGCAAIATVAPIASRPVKIARFSATLYGGYMLTEPIGPRSDGLFSPPGAVHNGIAGAQVACTRDLFVILEYNPGRAQQNLGFAVLYVFPRARP